jgi:hypothetical protein
VTTIVDFAYIVSIVYTLNFSKFKYLQDINSLQNTLARSGSQEVTGSIPVSSINDFKHFAIGGK